MRHLSNFILRCINIAVAFSFSFSLYAQELSRIPEPNPPHLKTTIKNVVESELPDKIVLPQATPTTEWTLHKNNDGSHPNAGEQQMMWLMNRARANPTAEGIFLAESTDPDVAGGRGFFNIDLDQLRSDFAAYPARPPSAFDIRMYNGSEAHSLDLIARDAQDHDGQFDRIDAAGFTCNGGRASVFSFSDSALNAHAALNIDWGGPESNGGVQDPPGHRYAIMNGTPTSADNYPNVGLALVPENDGNTDVGPLVFSGAYCSARTFGGTVDHHNRFLVGTVWTDQDGDSYYDQGEGLEGVTVMPDDGTYFAITGEAGGFAIPIEAPGDYSVTFSGGDLGETSYTKMASVASDSVLVGLETTTSQQNTDDQDDDGVEDGADNCPAIANADQANNDGDSDGDACDTDDDNDGMSDSFELTHSLDPFDSSDANEDADGDGKTNLEEFQDGSNPQVNEASVLLLILGSEE